MSSTAASVLAFVAVAAVLVLTPGVGTTYLLATVMSRGRRAAYLTAVGMVTGAAVHATVAVLGAAILVRALPQALTWIALVGGGLIVFLGARNLLLVFRPAPVAEKPRSPDHPHGLI